MRNCNERQLRLCGDCIEMNLIFESDVWHCYFLIDENSDVLGLVELSSRNIVDGCLTSPVAYLEGLYLRSEYRGKGMGKEVIKMILDWCRTNGFSELATDTELSNTKAQSFYQSAGFEETDRVVEFRSSCLRAGTMTSAEEVS